MREWLWPRNLKAKLVVFCCLVAFVMMIDAAARARWGDLGVFTLAFVFVCAIRALTRTFQ